MADDIPIYPPDVDCFILTDNGTGYDPASIKQNNCTVSQNMVNFLNLTREIDKYVGAYCTNPPKNDDCPFDFCPNPDIAGPLVRIANYVTAFCVAVLIFYSPRRVQEAFWSQILTIYSLLITCLISTSRGELTRFHALVVLALALSPITVYFVAYAIRSFWSGNHRLEGLLGRTRYLRRFIVLLAGAGWFSMFIYAYLPKDEDRFAQAGCKGRSVMDNFYLIVPFLYIEAALQDPSWSFTLALFVLPLAALVAAWIAGIYLRRKEIWPPGEPYRPRFAKVWRTVGYYYPFIQFMSVVAFPMGYWIATVELCTYGTQDNKFSLSFGQVFALFVAVPPIIQVTHLIEDVWYWFRGVAWVKRIAGPPPKRRMRLERAAAGMPDLMPMEQRQQTKDSYSDN